MKLPGRFRLVGNTGITNASGSLIEINVRGGDENDNAGKAVERWQVIGPGVFNEPALAG